MTSFSRENQPTTVPRHRFSTFCVLWIGRTDVKLFQITQKKLVGLWARPPVLLPSRSKITKTTAPHFKRNKNPQLRSSAPPIPALLCICAVWSKLLTQLAPSPLSSSDRNEASPSERFKNRQLEKRTVLRDVSWEMTMRHTPLAAAIVVAPQLEVSPFMPSTSSPRSPSG